MEQKGYYAVIPAVVRYNPKLASNAKLLYGELTALANEKGYCWAANQYFADLYGVSKRTIISWLKQLEKHQYIRIQLTYKPHSKEVAKRRIYILPVVAENQVPPSEKIFTGYGKKLHHPSEEIFTPPGEKNFTDNNTVINNTLNNTMNNNILSSSDEIDSTLYKKVIDYLNQKAGTHYKHTTKATKKVIHARLSEGFTLEDFYKVINNKTADWLRNPEFSQYLRPQTLFGTKFESYLQQPIKKNPDAKHKRDTKAYDNLF